jgi:hypothetical protein
VAVFNLLIRIGEWPHHRTEFMQSRMFEFTSDRLNEHFVRSGAIDFELLKELPALFAYEFDARDGHLPARVGRITRVSPNGRNYDLAYEFDHDVPPIPTSVLSDLRADLGIERGEFSRTHWAIKDADLFAVLYRHQRVSRPQPKIFTLPSVAVDPNLVGVMMPFDAGFNPVYDALKAAATDAGMVCQRADDFWTHDHVMQDIVDLICRSRMVICDLSKRNPNVFYEMGLAHMLGKDVVMITQSSDDVPFDVRSIRYVNYLKNAEGLRKLTTDVAGRLATLRSGAS